MDLEIGVVAAGDHLEGIELPHFGERLAGRVAQLRQVAMGLVAA